MYEICLNHFIFSSHGLSVVSIDYECLNIIIQVWFGSSIFVSGPQGSGAALCVLCAALPSPSLLPETVHPGRHIPDPRDEARCSVQCET